MENDFDSTLLELLLPMGLKDNVPLIDKKELFKELENKYLITTMLLGQVTLKDVSFADLGESKIKIYCKKNRKIILSDALWLLEYLQKGGKISGYYFELKRIFANKYFKNRMYVIDEIYIYNEPCNSYEKLLMLTNNLKITLVLDRIAEIWDIKFKVFNSLGKKYRFLQKINKSAEDVLREHKKVR